MNAVGIALAVSLGLLAAALAFLTVRGIARYRENPGRPQLAWTSGLGLAAAAMAVETAVYVGVENSAILQLYTFLSAAIVGVLSLGAARVLRRPRAESAYTGFVAASTGLLAVASAVTAIVPASMVTNGIIVGDPPLLLLVLSIVVTGPATVVLLASAALSLRRSFRWQTLMLIAGALVLGAGGTLYIASFPIALYYAEFLGIVLLFFGLISLPKSAPAASAGTLASSQG